MDAQPSEQQPTGAHETKVAVACVAQAFALMSKKVIACFIGVANQTVRNDETGGGEALSVALDAMPGDYAGDRTPSVARNSAASERLRVALLFAATTNRAATEAQP